MPPNIDVKDKVVAITGGSGGIGFACAELILSQGAKVSIADVSDKGLHEAEAKLTKAGHPGQIIAHVVDVRVVDQVDNWIAKTVERFGKLDGGVSMAGVIPKVLMLRGSRI